MKTLVVVFLIAVCLPAALWSQGEGKFDLYVNSGLSWPSQTTTFSSDWQMGYIFGFGVGYAFTSSLSLVSSCELHRFFMVEGTPQEDDGLYLVSLSDNLKVTLTPEMNSTSFYLIGGLGTSDVFNISNYASGITMTLGGGMDVPTSDKVSAFIEARYGVCFAKGNYARYVPLKLGARWRL